MILHTFVFFILVERAAGSALPTVVYGNTRDHLPWRYNANPNEKPFGSILDDSNPNEKPFGQNVPKMSPNENPFGNFGPNRMAE